MKWISCIAILMANASFGQIVIDQSDLPVAGDELYFGRAIDLQIDYASTGANYQWNFADLGTLTQSSNAYFTMNGSPVLIGFTYGSFAPTNYRASYNMPYSELPLAQLEGILPVDITEIKQYTRVTNQQLTLLGYSATISGQGVPIKSDTIETKYHFPLEYGDSYTSRGYTAMNMSPMLEAQWKQRRKRTSEVDGWGSITTPYGTFDVLRVKHMIEENDSITYSGTTIGLDVPVTFEYEWLAKGEKRPILKVVTSVVMGNEVVVSIEAKELEVVGLESVSAATDFTVFPNPATNKLTIQANEQIKTIRIMQLDGNVIETIESNQLIDQIDTDAYAQGMYFVSMELKGSVQKASFVKK